MGMVDRIKKQHCRWYKQIKVKPHSNLSFLDLEYRKLAAVIVGSYYVSFKKSTNTDDIAVDIVETSNNIGISTFFLIL